MSDFSQVTAVDRDKGLNGEVKYTLVEGGSGHFDVDSSTGTIVVRRPLGANSQNKNFTLKIKASDKGNYKHFGDLKKFKRTIYSDDLLQIMIFQPF